MSWHCERPGAWYYDRGEVQAFVFKGFGSLWAWAVYWHGGSASGVVHSFKRAQNKADITLVEIAIAKAQGATVSSGRTV